MEDLHTKIREVLARLDPENADAFNADGTPSVAYIRQLTGDNSITKADIAKAMETPDATEEHSQEPAPAPEASQEGQREPSETAVEAAEPDTGEDLAEETAPDPEIGIDPVDGLPIPDSRFDFMMRGTLMALIMRLPAALRRTTDKRLLDQMHEFVQSMGDWEEQQVAVEIIRSIVETAPATIPSGHYRLVIEEAFAVIRGELEQSYRKTSEEEQAEAAARYAKITKQAAEEYTQLEPGAQMPSALDSSPAQDQAASNLYGDAGVG